MSILLPVALLPEREQSSDGGDLVHRLSQSSSSPPRWEEEMTKEEEMSARSVCGYYYFCVCLIGRIVLSHLLITDLWITGVFLYSLILKQVTRPLFVRNLLSFGFLDRCHVFKLLGCARSSLVIFGEFASPGKTEIFNFVWARDCFDSLNSQLLSMLNHKWTSQNITFYR